MKRLGLIGRSLAHSFSPAWFSRKFQTQGLKDWSYEAFEMEDITGVIPLLAEPEMLGLNVTIPYKTAVIPYLRWLDPAAEKIGAVNTLVRQPDGWAGYNTDWTGFRDSLPDQLPPRALVLGNGGASLAVRYALEQMNLPFAVAARTVRSEEEYPLNAIPAEYLDHPCLWINTTPVGQYPKTEEALPLPYHLLTPDHLLYDLVYNPTLTRFLTLGAEQGARTVNGRRMLELQAEAAWQMWYRMAQ